MLRIFHNILGGRDISRPHLVTFRRRPPTYYGVKYLYVMYVIAKEKWNYQTNVNEAEKRVVMFALKRLNISDLFFKQHRRIQEGEGYIIII